MSEPTEADLGADVRAQLAPLVANAAREVAQLAKGRVELSEAACAGLAEWLAQRLEIVVAPVVNAMIGKGALLSARAVAQLSRADADALAAASWASIFAAHGDMVPLVERMIGEWREGVALLFKRYREDIVLLGDKHAVLSDIAVIGGAWKKSPTLRLTTGSGRSWFYKNHTLAIGAWLMELVRRLNEVGGLLPLHARIIEACPGYGWDSAVQGAPCANEAEAQRYYVRIGMWLRLMQVLGANDLHAKNLIAAGEHPVPIDHENLLQPPRADASTALGMARRARQRSPLESGLLPHLLVGEPGRPGVNAGGLEAGGDYRLPFKTPAGYPAIELPRTLPLVVASREHVVSARAGLDSILAGFDAMHELLAHAGARVLNEMLPLAEICEVRVLRRPAHITRRLIVESLQPAVLLRPGARAALLVAKAHPADRRSLTEIEVPRQYELPALGFVLRTRTIDEHAHDRAVIATAIICGIPPSGPSLNERSASAPAIAAAELAPLDASIPARNELLRAAVQLGDLLLAEGHHAGDALHWLGVAWHPLADARVIEVLPNDLLSGNAGLAVVLASLFHVTREARFATAARHAVAPVARALAATSPQGAWRPWGAYLGSAGQVYAIHRVAALLGDAATLPSAAQVVQLLQSPSGGIDLATGTAGLVAVVAQVMSPAPAWLDALGDVLRDALRKGLPPLPYPRATMPAYLPDAATGVAFALRRLAPNSVPISPQALEPRDWDVADAATLLRRQHETGSWTATGLSDQLNLSGMLGVGAAALSLLRAAAPEAKIPSLWQLD